MINTQEFLDALDVEIVTFTFTKTTGFHRISRGTRNLRLIPENAHPKGTGTPKPEGVVAYYDLRVNQWRSFRLNTLFGDWKVTDNDLKLRLEEYKRQELDEGTEINV